MRAPHTVGACKLESACTGAGFTGAGVPAPEMPRHLRLRTMVVLARGRVVRGPWGWRPLWQRPYSHL